MNEQNQKPEQDAGHGAEQNNNQSAARASEPRSATRTRGIRVIELVMLLLVLSIIGGYLAGFPQFGSVGEYVTSIKNITSPKDKKETKGTKENSIEVTEEENQSSDVDPTAVPSRHPPVQLATNQQLVIAEMIYLVKTAQITLAIHHDPKTALALIQSAKSLADSLGEKELINSINSDIKSLQGMANNKRAETNESLITLMRDLQSLPFKKPNYQSLDQFELKAKTDSDNTADDNRWHQVWDTVSQSVKHFVQVSKLDDTAAVLMVPQARGMVILLLQSQLQQVQWALLQQEFAIYQKNLSLIEESIMWYFDMGEKVTQTFLEKLQQLKKITAPDDLPTIGASLPLLEKKLVSPALSQQSMSRN